MAQQSSETGPKKDKKIVQSSLIQTKAVSKNLNPTTGLIDLSEQSDDEAKDTNQTLIAVKSEDKNKTSNISQPEVDHPPTEEIKSMLSEENMRVAEHKKHASAIQKRIQQLEEQIKEEENKTQQLK